MTVNEEVALLSGREIITGDTELEEWDMGEYKQDARLIIVLGKRNTGKTVWTMNFCYAHRAVYPYALVVTSTKFNGFWQQFFPDYLIRDKFNPEDINRLFEAQKDRVLLQGINSRILIIFDDMAAETALRYSEELTRIAYNGRHFNADVLYLTQDVVKATTAMRRNADNFIMFTMAGQPSLDHVYKEYASVDFVNFAHMQQCMLKYTMDYGALVIDNTDSSLRGKDRFKWSRGKPLDEIPQFTMLCPAAWGARDASHRAELANEQRKKYARSKKYKESYMKALKNKQDTQISSEQVQGTTKNQQQTRSVPTSSLFAQLASRHSRDI